MIGRLTGSVVAQGDDGVATVDVGGVGYEVMLPLGALGRAHREPDGRVTLHVHTVVREDALLLYGFPSLEDRQVFRTLLGVASVGPKIAVAILGALSVEELAAAITRKEIVRLTGISGVGKKTAERLVLELKDKLAGMAHGVHPAGGAEAGVGAGAQPQPHTQSELLRSALANMGFRPVEVERAVDAVRERIEHAALADLVRDALAAAATKR